MSKNSWTPPDLGQQKIPTVERCTKAPELQIVFGPRREKLEYAECVRKLESTYEICLSGPVASDSPTDKFPPFTEASSRTESAYTDFGEDPKETDCVGVPDRRPTAKGSPVAPDSEPSNPLIEYAQPPGGERNVCSSVTSTSGFNSISLSPHD